MMPRAKAEGPAICALGDAAASPIHGLAEFPDGKTMMGKVPKKAWIKMLAERM